MTSEVEAKLDRDLSQAMEERDRAEAYADQLADCIEAITGIENGEHSSGNFPWENAIAAAQEYLVRKQPAEPASAVATEAAAQYPLITKLFELISSDNGGCTADEIEESLRALPDSDLEILAAGEYTDQEVVKTKLREQFDAPLVDSLDALLEVAFQGCYALGQQPHEPRGSQDLFVCQELNSGLCNFEHCATCRKCAYHCGCLPETKTPKQGD